MNLAQQIAEAMDAGDNASDEQKKVLGLAAADVAIVQ
jgi:hypothetical protein